MVVRATGVTDALDLVDRVVRLGAGVSPLVGDTEAFVFDLVFLAGAVSGTDMVCRSPR